MILVDPAHVIMGAGLIALLTFVVGFWFGYRLGHIKGVCVWHKSYRWMSASDIEAHKEVIRQMDARKSREGK